jgi:hypothetical protein
LDIADERLQGGVSSLAQLATTRTEEARRLAIGLARYKFVANLLAGRHDVCEVGRSHPLGIRFVLSEVKKMAVYDDDESFIADFRRRNQDMWTLQADVHDVIREHLPRTHDAIFSFDVLERTAPEYEDDCIRHIRDSLSKNSDIAIISCPAHGHDERLSGKSEAIHTRSGLSLRDLLQRHFNAVMLFSMNDEFIQPGISPDAHYFLAVCCAKKG